MKRKSNLWLPSLADIFFLCPFLFLSLDGGKKLLNDAGTGFHIGAGEYMLSNMTVPRYDVFSHVSPPLPWFVHEWLSEVLMALIHRAFGLTGIVLCFSFLISLTYFVLFKLAHVHGGNVIFAGSVVFLAAVSSTLHWLARPHVFTIFLTLVWYIVLVSYQERDKNYLFLLPLTMFLWVNLHGGFVIGFVLLTIYLLGNAVEVVLGSEQESYLSKNKFRMLAYIAFACLLCSLVNPATYKVLLFPLKLVSNQSLVNIIMEYRSPDFHESLPFTYLLLFTVAVLAISPRKVNTIELLLVLVFTYMSLYSVRHIPLFAIVIAPIVARHMSSIFESAQGSFAAWLKRASQNLQSIDDRLRGHLWPATASLLICAVAAAGLIRFDFDTARMPVSAVEFLKGEKIPGRMYNPEQFGDYVIYAAWPQYKVFIDGRLDMYGAARINELHRVATVQPGWQEILAKYDINFVFNNANSPVSVLLAQREDWRLIYRDNVATIFVRDSIENQRLIEKYSKRVPPSKS